LLFVVVFVRFYALQRAKIRIFLHIRRICAKEKCKKAKTTGAMPANALHFVGYDTWFSACRRREIIFCRQFFALLAGASLAAA